MQLKKILLPVDLAGTNVRLASQAAVIAGQFGAEIVLLHVMQTAAYPRALLESVQARSEGHDDFEDQLLRALQPQLEATLREQLDGLPVRRVLARGAVAPRIEQTALEEGVDLIMMATHSHDVIYRYLIGSVTSKILHQNRCPLWTDAYIPADPTYRFSVRRMLCAIDLDAHSAQTLTRAREVAAAFDAQLTLVHVTPSVEIYGPGGSIPVRWRDEMLETAGVQLERLQQQVGGASNPTIIDSGNVPEALNRAAHASGADLLVIGRLPAGGHLGANGAGDALVRGSVIPVLSI
jgi:nucleotide-binding universal stress UspA family protein